ncbi:DUF262 domain-containing protein [Empedobacter brevis]
MNIEDKILSEIEEIRKEIKTDNFSMAIRELVQVYKDGDLELFPSYQRLFRWKDDQKTRFIESLLMGIPTPPIFIAQKKGSKWTIVDGLQRISTILQLMGLFADNRGVAKPTFTFTPSEKIPSLEGLSWDTLPEDAKRIIKMSKIDLKIIFVEENVSAQYELFKRLNTGSVVLSPQEIRNCLMIMLNEEYYTKIDEVKNFQDFKEAICITENKEEIEYPMELILRYFIMKHNKIDFSNYNLSKDLLSDFIDKETIKLIEDREFDIDSELNIFRRLCILLNKILGSNSFKKYDNGSLQFEGGFLQVSFEGIVSGLANNIHYYEDNESLLLDKIKDMYQNETYLENAKRGTKALSRIKNMIEFSNQYFTPND